MVGRRYEQRTFRGRPTLASLVVEALRESGRPMTLDELAHEAVARGFRHEAKPRNPQQVRASISAMPHKNPWVRRTGRGLYDLTELGRKATSRERPT